MSGVGLTPTPLHCGSEGSRGDRLIWFSASFSRIHESAAIDSLPDDGREFCLLVGSTVQCIERWEAQQNLPIDWEANRMDVCIVSGSWDMLIPFVTARLPPFE